jgi:hypothetical protein
MAATARLQKELEIKSKEALATSKDPVERLRAACLARGAQGIKGLSTYVLCRHRDCLYIQKFFAFCGICSRIKTCFYHNTF